MTARRRLSQILSFNIFRRASAPGATVPVVTETIRALNPIPVPDGGGNSDWVETWTPGQIDVWTAVRYVDGELQAEYELSCRNPITIHNLHVVINGYGTITIPVNRLWPAGRAISGRVGAEWDFDATWDPDNAGPLDMKLPTYSDQASIAAAYAAHLSTLRNNIAVGRAGDSNALCTFEDSQDGILSWEGPFPCWGLQNGGASAPGGQGIYHPWGWQQSTEYLRFCVEAEAVAMSRMWCFRKADGTHASVDDYLPDLSPRVDDEAAIRLSGWDSGADLVMRPQSVTHYSRVLRYVGFVAEATRSPLALRHLKQLAECARLIWTENGQIAAVEFGNGWTIRNLSTYAALTYNRPRHTGLYTAYGAGWDRAQAWPMLCAAHAKKLGMTWTAGWQDWASTILSALEWAQMPNGLIGRVPMPPTSGYPLGFDICASMHECLLGIGAKALSYQTGIAIPGIDAGHAQALFNYANDPTALQEQVYSGQYGPWHWIAVASNGGAPLTYLSNGYSEPSNPLNPGDPAHNETYLAVKYATTSDANWLTRSLKFGTQAADLATKKSNCAGTTNIINRNWEAWLYALLP